MTVARNKTKDRTRLILKTKTHEQGSRELTLAKSISSETATWYK